MDTCVSFIALVKTLTTKRILTGLVTTFVLLAAVASAGEGLKLEQAGTDKVYFTYNGKPLLSFGGLSDFIFYAAEDAYDYKLWADWAAEHGINHVRAYPPLSWKHIEKFTKENGGSLENMLFPYEETKPGSRKFDLTRFNTDYWKRLRRQCEYLQSKGIYIHLLMWNGWQLRASDTPGRDKSDIDWSGHFFNPANNVNSFTDHLGPDLQNRFAIYHSVADKKTGLVNAQKAWFCKLVEMTADLDNVYYDLVHEMKEHYRDWEKTRLWIEQMTLSLRDHHNKLQPGRPVLVGMDSGGFSEAQRDWIFTRPYFDILIYGKKHTVENAREWRTKYKKPYIPQESWDDDGQKYSYIHPEQRVNTRKYMWKFMMAKCQQMDLYMKPRIGFSSENLPKFPHNYDPRGRSEFEDDALVLRTFWDRLTDYPNLWFNGSIEYGPDSHRYVLSSKKEAVAYCSSATAKEGVKFKSELLKIKNLSLASGTYTADIIKPDIGAPADLTVTVKGGTLSVRLPAFTDDIAVHIYRSSDRTTGFEVVPMSNRFVLDLSADDVEKVMRRVGFSDDQIQELGTDVHNGMLVSGAVRIKINKEVEAVFAANGDDVYIGTRLRGNFIYNVKTGWRRPDSPSPRSP